jgi:hypothetical protein
VNRQFFSWVFPLVLVIVMRSGTGAAQQPRRFDKTFDGQILMAVNELKMKVDADPELKGRKLRLGKFTTELIDSHFEQQFERSLGQHAADLLSADSAFTVSGSYDYVPGTQEDNIGLKVVQFTLEVKNAQRRRLQHVIGEINNTGDITKIVPITVAIPVAKDIVKRNQAVSEADAMPAFALNGSLVMVPGQPDYSVEIRVRRGGVEPLVPIVPVDRGGRPWVDLAVTDEFEISLVNGSQNTDAVAVVEIDGLDVVNEFCEDPKGKDGKAYEGYDVTRGGAPVAVKGWLRTVKSKTKNVYTFVVNEFGKGAATARKSRSTRGVINVQFFEAVPQGQNLPARAIGEVGVGRPIDVDLQAKSVVRSEVPKVNLAIHYLEDPQDPSENPQVP